MCFFVFLSFSLGFSSFSWFLLGFPSDWHHSKHLINKWCMTIKKYPRYLPEAFHDILEQHKFGPSHLFCHTVLNSPGLVAINHHVSASLIMLMSSFEINSKYILRVVGWVQEQITKTSFLRCSSFSALSFY